MRAYSERSRDELLKIREKLEQEYQQSKTQGLALNMSRGNPAELQLDLSMGMLDVLNSQTALRSEDGVDCRNYGGLDGIPEARQLIADMLEINSNNVIARGNSSLNLMYDSISKSMTHGVNGTLPWCKLGEIKFLCPAPGYDRHFSIMEHFGIEMITIPMTQEGPDMDMVEHLVKKDASIKGIWCVPKYSNPQGITYSDATVRRFANLSPAAKDFRIYWDNAYVEHHLYENQRDELLNIMDECKNTGKEDMVYIFCSTSKISFAGSGIAALATSEKNIKDILGYLTVQTIGPDKINQLRHVKFFKGIQGLRKHMCKHADILRPKFELVLKIFNQELSGLDIGVWNNPKGGYFIAFDTLDGCAKAVVEKAKDAGLIMTNAGATYPYSHDPKDSNLRLAPSYPNLTELAAAVNVFVLCVKIVSIEKILADKEKAV